MDRWGQCAMWQCFQTIPVHHLVWSLVEIRGRCCGQQRIYGSTSTFSRDLENKVIVGFFTVGFICSTRNKMEISIIWVTFKRWTLDWPMSFQFPSICIRHQVVHSIERWRQPRIGFGNWNFVLRRTSRRSLHRPGFQRSPVHLGNAYRHLQWNPARRELPSDFLISASYGGKFEWRCNTIIILKYTSDWIDNQ